MPCFFDSQCSCVETELHKNRGNKLGKECNGVVCAVWMICVGCNMVRFDIILSVLGFACM